MLSGSTHNGDFLERIICYILYKDDDYIVFLFRNKSILILNLTTYKTVGLSIANYAAPVWSNTSMEKIQVAQNEALRISTGAHKMSSIDHLHCEAQMLKIMEHSDLLSAQ